MYDDWFDFLAYTITLVSSFLFSVFFVFYFTPAYGCCRLPCATRCPHAGLHYGRCLQVQFLVSLFPRLQGEVRSEDSRGVRRPPFKSCHPLGRKFQGPRCGSTRPLALNGTASRSPAVVDSPAALAFNEADVRAWPDTTNASRTPKNARGVGPKCSGPCLHERIGSVKYSMVCASAGVTPLGL